MDWQKETVCKTRLQEEETDRESFVFEKINLGSRDICIMENGSGSGKLWKKTADLHIAMGEPEAFSDETGKLSALRPHHVTDRPKTVPAGSRNLGFAGAFSRLEKGFCLTGNYAVSSARSTVDELMHAGNGWRNRREKEVPDREMAHSLQGGQFIVPCRSVTFRSVIFVHGHARYRWYILLKRRWINAVYRRYQSGQEAA